MSDHPTARERARREAERRRRMAEIFGEVIPEQTSDDSEGDTRAGRRTEEEAQEDWLKRQVPPHHGRSEARQRLWSSVVEHRVRLGNEAETERVETW